MARTTLAVLSLTGCFPPSSTDQTPAAADAVNGNDFALTGGEVIIVRNSGASGRTFTLESAPDAFNRLGNVTETIGAGKTRVYGPFAVQGWRQTSGKMHVTGEHSELEIVVLKPPF